MNRSPTTSTLSSVSAAWGMISFQLLGLGSRVSMAITRPRGASRSVLNQKTGPSLSRNEYSWSKLSISSTSVASGVVEGLVEDAVLVVGPLGDGDDQVLAVVGDVAVELPLLLVGPLVDERRRRPGACRAGGNRASGGSWPPSGPRRASGSGNRL